MPGRSVARAEHPAPRRRPRRAPVGERRRPPEEQPLQVVERLRPEPPELGHHRPVHGDEPVAVEEHVQRGDVAEARRRPWAGGRGAPPRGAAGAAWPRSPPRAHQTARASGSLAASCHSAQAPGVVPGQVALPGHDVVPHPRHEPEPVPQHREPLLEGFRVERAGRGDDPDDVAPLQGWRLDHRREHIFPVIPGSRSPHRVKIPSRRGRLFAPRPVCRYGPVRTVSTPHTPRNRRP